MGELKYFLGLQVDQRIDDIFICQSKYLKELLKKYNMEDSTSTRTPSSTTAKLGACDSTVKVDVSSYRGMIGSLLYLTVSRPDIMYATCLCARFQTFKLSKSHLVDEWSCFFDTLIKVFANCTKISFSNISSLLLYIGFVVANNQRINFAQLIWHIMVRRIIASKRDYRLGNKVQCYYPRFISIILNHILSPEHVVLFNNSAFEVAQTTNKKFYTRLATSLKYTNIPVVVTPYLSNYIHLPIIQTEQVHQVHQPPVDQSTQAGVLTPL